MRMSFVAVGALLAGASLLTPASPLPATITLSGNLTYRDYERIVEHPFEVPPGTRSLSVVLDATVAERRTVIDLGLRDPDGLRGWSGGRTTRISVSRLGATAGYLPGPLPPGRWAVLVGVPNIRPDSEDSYTLTVTLSGVEPADRILLRAGPGWFVGDLHAHSYHSDGHGRSQAGVDVPVPLHRILDRATGAGLDFLLVSDHNTVSHWLDLDRLQPYCDRLLLLHGREITTYRGHANTVGERAFDEFRLETPEASPATVLRRIANAGAFVSLNHPTAPDDERCMGCGWNVTDEEMRQAVHGVEVVNGTAREGPLYGWPFWVALLNRGWRVTAVGASDDHTPDDGSDRTVGTPATVVWASELSEAAIVEGLRSGRVYVRTRGPQSPSLDLSAVVAGTTYPMGSTIPETEVPSIRLRAVLDDASGQTLEWIRNGRVFARVDVTSARGTFDQSVSVAPGDWFSVVVRDQQGPTLLSNTIAFGPPLSRP